MEWFAGFITGIFLGIFMWNIMMDEEIRKLRAQAYKNKGEER